MSGGTHTGSLVTNPDLIKTTYVSLLISYSWVVSRWDWGSFSGVQALALTPMLHKCKASPLVLSGGKLKENQSLGWCVRWENSAGTTPVRASPLLMVELHHQNDKWNLLIKFQITTKGIWQLLITSRAKWWEKVIFLWCRILCNSDQTLHKSYYRVTDVRLFIVTDVKDYYQSLRANHSKKKALTVNLTVI